MVITATADKQMSGEAIGMVKVLLKHRKSVRYLLFNIISIGAKFCTSTDSIELTVSILNFLITPFLASEGTSGLSRRSVVDKLCYALSINLITCI